MAAPIESSATTKFRPDAVASVGHALRLLCVRLTSLARLPHQDSVSLADAVFLAREVDEATGLRIAREIRKCADQLSARLDRRSVGRAQ